MNEPVQKIYNSIQEALMDYARLGVDAARRPKPQSLKEQALKTLEEAPGPDYPRAMTVLNAEEHALIRRALEALPDD
jgi:DNA-directed RNA polymerase specialized sigma24 family protein